eukprot:73818_1
MRSSTLIHILITLFYSSSSSEIYDYPSCKPGCLANIYPGCPRGIPCHQVPGRIYKVNGICYKALSACYGCLDSQDIHLFTSCPSTPTCPDLFQCSSCTNTAQSCINTATICPDDMYQSFKEKNVTAPWFNYIATSREYDELSDRLQQPQTTDIRLIYGVFSHGQLNTMLTLLSNLKLESGINTHQPSSCNDICWTNTKNALKSEIILLLDLGHFRDQMTTFFTDSNNNFQTQVSAVIKLLSIGPEHQVISKGDNTLSTAWTIGMGIVNSFALGLAIAAPTVGVPLKLFAWVVTSTRIIGGGIIAAHNSGGEYNITINLNNALYIKSSEFVRNVQETFDNEKHQLNIDKTAIANNYGKLNAFNTCSKKLNAAMTNAGLSFESVISQGITESTSGMIIQTYQALLPSKYQLWTEFVCTDHRAICCDKKRTPGCWHSQAPTHARTGFGRPIAAGTGEYNFWVGPSVSDLPHDAISKDAVKLFDQALQNVTTSEYSFMHILNTITLRNHQEPVSIKIADQISFSFHTNEVPRWCETECRLRVVSLPPVRSWCGYNTVSCTHCDRCESRCGQSCGSCLSSSTNVLMANNEWKSIKDIEVGDMIMNPLNGEGQQVLIIDKPIRNRRALYSINNLPFRFTKAHPFSLYNDSGNDTIGAVDINELLFYNPTVDNNNLNHINLDTQLSIYSSGSIQPLLVNNLDVSEFNETEDEDGEILYDLVLNFGAPSMFIINDGIIVYNEWYDLNKFPKSTQIVLGMLAQLVKEKNHTLYKLSKRREMSRNLINNVSTLIAQYTLSFYNIIDHHVENLMVKNDLSSCNTYSMDMSNITNTVKSLFSDDLWAIRKAIEAFIANVSPRLSYTFHSKQYKYYNQICFDEVGTNQLITLLDNGIYEATDETLEYMINKSLINTTSTDTATTDDKIDL